MAELIWNGFAGIGIWFTCSLITAGFWILAKRGAGRT